MFSWVKYTGDATTRNFAVPFPYLDRDHIDVKVYPDATSQTVLTAPWTWLDAGTIRFNSAPLVGRRIEIRRRTPNVTSVVEFNDGSVFTENDLNLAIRQVIYLNQETNDLAEELAEELEQETEEGITAIRSSLRGINTRALAAQSSAAAAQSSATAATTTANAAMALITSVGGQIATDRATVQAALTTVTSLASAADVDRIDAQAAQAAAATSAANALASANAAAASAAAAALAANFNPNDFYTKVQMDALLNTRSFQQSQITGLTTALNGKADTAHTHAISDVSGLTTALDGRLAVGATAAAAAQLATTRTITLTGDVTGSVGFNGSANVSMTTDVPGLDAKVGSVVAGDGIRNTVRLGDAVTVNLGIPSTITETSTNAVTASSHTHELSPTGVRRVFAAAITIPDIIGATCFLRRSTSGTVINRGEDYPGSSLRFAGVLLGGTDSGVATAVEEADNAAPTGTWRALGSCRSGLAGTYAATTFIKVA